MTSVLDISAGGTAGKSGWPTTARRPPPMSDGDRQAQRAIGDGVGRNGDAEHIGQALAQGRSGRSPGAPGWVIDTRETGSSAISALPL